MTQKINELIAFVKKHEENVPPGDRCVLLMKDGEPWYMENHDHAMGWVAYDLGMDKVKEIAENPDDYGYLITHIDYEDIIEYVTYTYENYKKMN